ncbi:MAG: methyltransferase family protein [Candidatus Thorarchaeota archaeon]
MSKGVHAQSFMLPITVAIMVPLVILFLTEDWEFSWRLLGPYLLPAVLLGVAPVIAGIALMYTTINLFASVGKGTLAPWNPTQRLVVLGPYRYVRNPMISGVLLVLLGESILFTSFGVFLWFLFLLVGNHIYFVRSEEPGLVKRFGEPFLRYCENVPRWIPRTTPWDPAND